VPDFGPFNPHFVRDIGCAFATIGIAFVWAALAPQRRYALAVVGTIFYGAHALVHVFDTLREGLERGKSIKLSGFGNFDLRQKNQRPGRNPKTGQEIPISARTVVTFRPGQKLKERVEAYAGSGQ